MAEAIYHLILNKGTDDFLNLHLKQAVVVLATARPRETQIRISPLPVDLADNTTLYLGDIAFTLSAAVSAGVEVLPVEVLTRQIVRGSQIEVAPVDLTGGSSSAQIYGTGITAVNLSASFVGDPAEGQLKLSIPIEAIATTPTNCTWDELPAESDRQSRDKYPIQLWNRGYNWHFDVTDGEGITKRRLLGRCFVYS